MGSRASQVQHAIEDTYVKWYNEASSEEISSARKFEENLRDRLRESPHLPSAIGEVRELTTSAEGSGTVFTEADGPGQYWEVRVGANRHVLPVPTEDGFKATEGFDVDRESPDKLEEITPAALQSNAGRSGHRLRGRGHVSSSGSRGEGREPGGSVGAGAGFGGSSSNRAGQDEDAALQEAIVDLTAARELLKRRDREKKELEVQFERKITSLYADRQMAESALLVNRRKFGDDAARRMLTNPDIYFDGPEDGNQKFANPGRGHPFEVGDQTDADLKRANELKRELEQIGDEQRTLRDIVAKNKATIPGDHLENAPRPTAEDLNAAMTRIEEEVTEKSPAARAQRILGLAEERQSAEEIESDQEALKEVTALAGDTLREQTERARSDFQKSRKALERSLLSVYKNPRKAAERFQSRFEQEGFQEAITTLTESPETYGTLSRNVDEDGLSWASKSFVNDQEGAPTAAEAYLNAPGGKDGGEVKTAAEFALRWSKKVEMDTQNLMERQNKTRSEVYREGNPRTRQAIDRAAGVLGSTKREYDRLSLQLVDNPQDNYETELDDQLERANDGVWERLKSKVQQIGGWTNQKTTGSQNGRSHPSGQNAGQNNGAGKASGGTQNQSAAQGQRGQSSGGGPNPGGQTAGGQTAGGQATGRQTAGGQATGGQATGGQGWRQPRPTGPAGAHKGQGASPQAKAKSRSLAMTVKRREQALESFLNRIYKNPTDAQSHIENEAFKGGLSTKTSAFKNTQQVIQDDLRWFGDTDDAAIRQLKYNDQAETKDKGRRTWRWGRLGAEIAEGVVEQGPDEVTEEAVKKIRTAAKGTGFLVAGATAYGAMKAKDKAKKAWRNRQARKKAKKELNRRLKKYGNALQKYQSHLNKQATQSPQQNPGRQGQAAGGQAAGGQGGRQTRPTGPAGAGKGAGTQNAGSGQKQRQGSGGTSSATGSSPSGQGGASTGGSPSGPSQNGNTKGGNTKGGNSQTGSSQGRSPSGSPANSSSPPNGSTKAGVPRSGSSNKSPSGRGAPSGGSNGGPTSRGNASSNTTSSPTGNGKPGNPEETATGESSISDVKQKATQEAVRGKKAVESDHVTLGGQPRWFSERSARSSSQAASNTATQTSKNRSASTSKRARGERSKSRSQSL